MKVAAAIEKTATAAPRAAGSRCLHTLPAAVTSRRLDFDRNECVQTEAVSDASTSPLEREADAIAERVLTGSARAVSAAMPGIQRFFAEQPGALAPVAAAGVGNVIARTGMSLEPRLRRDMEQRFLYDFSRVRIHADTAAAQSAADMDANAYTVGYSIVFGPGAYAPETYSGRRLLAHELTHVVQQAGGKDAGAGGDEDPGPQPYAAPPMSSSLKYIQRQRRGHAGGCGVCVGSALLAGEVAHVEIQNAWVATDPELRAEFQVPVVLPGEPAPFTAAVDIAKEVVEGDARILYIGEIKSLDDDGIQAGIGRRQLQDYWINLSVAETSPGVPLYDEVLRFQEDELPVPAQPLPFHDPRRPPTCPPQFIHVQFIEPGLYQYYCTPSWAELMRDHRRDCACPREPEEHSETPSEPQELSGTVARRDGSVVFAFNRHVSEAEALEYIWPAGTPVRHPITPVSGVASGLGFWDAWRWSEAVGGNRHLIDQLIDVMRVNLRQEMAEAVVAPVRSSAEVAHRIPAWATAQARSFILDPEARGALGQGVTVLGFQGQAPNGRQFMWINRGGAYFSIEMYEELPTSIEALIAMTQLSRGQARLLRTASLEYNAAMEQLVRYQGMRPSAAYALWLVRAHDRLMIEILEALEIVHPGVGAVTQLRVLSRMLRRAPGIRRPRMSARSRASARAPAAEARVAEEVVEEAIQTEDAALAAGQALEEAIPPTANVRVAVDEALQQTIDDAATTQRARRASP